MTTETKAPKVSLKAKTAAIAKAVMTDRNVLTRAVQVLYDRQTQTEKAHHTTMNANKVGVSRAHGKAITTMGEKLSNGGKLAGEDVDFLRGPGPRAVPRITLYAEQLARAGFSA